MSYRRKHLVALTATAALAVSVAAAISTPAEAALAPRAVADTKPAWTAHAKHLGKARDTARVSARVYLQPKGGIDALRAAAVAMSTPGSSSYHKFLTEPQYQARFGVPASSVRAVRSWLRGDGLTVTGVGAHNRFVAVRGTVRAAERAFGTSIQRYRHGTQTVQAPASAVTTPAALASSVLTVTGLDTTSVRATPTIVAPTGFRNAHPCSAYWGQLKATVEPDGTPIPTFQGQVLPYAPCGYTGTQFRSAYEGNSALDGAGVGVAIIDAYTTNHIASDAETYADNHGDGSYAPGQFSQVVAGPFTHTGNNPVTGCSAPGWGGEESLDVEAVHAMAPAANIVYYGAASCYDQDLLDAQAAVVDQDAVQIVTNSYGEPDEGESTDQIAASEEVFLQGATEGITFTFSSGDNGDEVAHTGLKQTDSSASDPYVTAVGGTSAGIGASGKLLFQTGWGTEKYLLSDGSWSPVGYLYGAGGGYSTLFNQPSYQQGVVHSSYRGVPDVAMDADVNTGMLIGLTQRFSDGTYYDEYRIGGTSLASPLFAGMTALKIEANGGQGYGLLNPVIYDPANRADFTDVKRAPNHIGDVRVDFANGENASNGLLYSVRTFGQDSSLATTTGWDPVTGLGTPNSGWLTK